MRVMVGGTFDMLHIGHQALLKLAFETAGPDGFVIIGLSSDEFAGRKQHPVRPFETRKTELTNWIRQNGFSAGYTIDPLHDQFGSACTIDFDVLVVSYETYPAGELINRNRREAGLKPVALQTVPCICAEDGKAVSTTRIYQGDIDKFGNAGTKQAK
ncbi:MAG TPA: phosphopantetheine adenylyltransferase [Methanocorpusculum sp.]|nr:phosphopantetheine adenylyltransferase [Methanocorpusculum sp.]